MRGRLSLGTLLLSALPWGECFLAPLFARDRSASKLWATVGAPPGRGSGYKAFPPQQPPAQLPQLPALKDWLHTNGVQHPSVELSESEVDGRGLYASKHIKKDDVLFVLPKDLVLRPTLPVSISGSSAQTALAVRLLLERHRGAVSPFAGYIRSLPSAEEMHLPLLWPNEDLALLDTPDGEVFRWRAAVAEEAEEVLRVVRAHSSAFDGLTFTTQDWLWARAISLSRPYLLDPEDEWSLAIIPLVDFSNHRDDADCAIRCLEDGSVAFVAGRAYAPGEQVWTSYGQVSASHKFFTFGFLEELFTQTGSRTGVPSQGSSFLSFPLADDNHARDLKLRVAASAGLQQPAEFEVRVRSQWGSTDGRSATVLIEDEEEVRRLIGYLRLALAGPDELDEKDGASPEEIWARFYPSAVTPQDREAVTVALEACRDTMATAGERLVACQNRICEQDAAVQRAGKAATPAQSIRAERLKLASLWLQGELLAVQALAQYLLAAIGASDQPRHRHILSYD